MFSKVLHSDIFEAGMLFERDDIFYPYQRKMSEALSLSRRTATEALNREVWSDTRDLLKKVNLSSEKSFYTSQGILSSKTKYVDGHIESLAKQLIPWRKGPWDFGGLFIDAEWRSDIKYEGIREIIKSVHAPSIVDIGSGNGYYGFRALEDGASQVLCLDPSEKFFFQFEFFQKFAQDVRIQYELLGYQFARELPMKFDMAFCMGILYHQKNPFEVLDCAKEALRPGGLLVLESMTYPSDESFSFIPPGRYAKARNVYQVPSVHAMVSMCKNSGFHNVEILFERPSSIEEQRRTEYAPYESLSDFLDSDDPTKTIEGYLAPKRAVVLARKRK